MRRHPSDFFEGLNTLAIILEVPDGALGRHIGVWATTEQWVDGSWVARDQMGRPAINTVFNHTAADKEQFNVTPPSQQATVDGGKFRTNSATRCSPCPPWTPRARTRTVRRTHSRPS